MNLSEKREIKENRKIYYEVGDKEYEIPMFEKYAEYLEDKGETIKVKKKDNGKYVITFDEMSPEEKYSVLKDVLDKALTYVAVLTNQVYGDEPNVELKRQRIEELQSLCRTSGLVEHIAKTLYSENKIDEANGKLDKKIQEILEFYQKQKTDEKEMEL